MCCTLHPGYLQFKGAVGNLEEREDLALNLNKYNFQIPPPPSPLLSCPASTVPPREEAAVHATHATCARNWRGQINNMAQWNGNNMSYTPSS